MRAQQLADHVGGCRNLGATDRSKMVQTGRLENIRDSATGTIGQRCGGSVECRSDVNHLACKQLGRGGGFAAPGGKKRKKGGPWGLIKTR